MKLLVLDNYDSFTYNVVHLLRHIGVTDIEVHRNDRITVEAVGQYDRIVLSPGPGIPLEAGIMPEVVRAYGPTKSIFGVCLGHQCIGEVYGGTLRNLGAPVHGKGVPTRVINQKELLFQGLPSTIVTGRYHSWVVSREGFPNDLTITAEDDKGEIMALSHKIFDVRGVQFHPESVLTEHGESMIRNWLNRK